MVFKEEKMKKFLAIMLTLTMLIAITACSNSSTEEAQANDQDAVTEEAASEVQTPERDLPEGEYEDIGDGSFYLTGPSGSTENGDEIVLYPEMDMWPHASVGIELWDMDGSIQTFIYVDGVELDKKQVGAGYQGSLDFDDDSLWAITEGEHKVEAVQYADNDPANDMTFYRSVAYTVKAE